MKLKIRQTGLSLMVLSLTSFVAMAEDAPDLAKEARFHRLYKKYNEAPTSEEAWRDALSKGQSQTYTVGRGDTLWDISNTFFADPGFWPKIWSLNNSEVQNPHEIVPEQEIHFTEGTFGEPPSVEVREPVPEEVQVAEAAPPIEKPEPHGTFPDGEVDPDEVPAAKATSSKRSGVPRSLPDWQALTGFNEFHIVGKPAIQGVSAVDLPLTDFVSESSPQAEGFVSETESGLRSASDKQYFYVKFEQPPTTNRYLSVHEVGPLENGKSRAKLYQIEGEILVMEKVSTEKNIYRARALQTFTHFTVGSQLITGDIIMINTSEISGLTPPIEATIIGGHYEDNRKIFAKQDVVYLNAGTENGMAVGQLYTIYKNREVRVPDSELTANPLPIGRLKIVATEGRFATAVITSQSEEIRKGDSLSGPPQSLE